MNSRIFEKVYQTAKMKTERPMARLALKGWQFVVIGDEAGGEPDDVHGIPGDYTAYGRCGVYNNGDLFMDGGTNGSKNGHPNTVAWGGYWGSKLEKMKDGTVVPTVYVRGRAGVPEKVIRQAEYLIIDWISKNVPKA